MEQLSLTGMQLVQGIFATVVLIIGIIFLLRQILKVKAAKYQPEKNPSPTKYPPLSTRNKYIAVNAFRWRGPLLKTGLAVSLLVTLFAFSWTTFEEEIDLTGIDLDLEDEFIKEIPRTFDLPKPPPPPPPPPIIKEVPDEEPIEEEVTFVDNSIDVEEETLPPAPVVKQKAPPPPPPPLPDPVEEVPDFFVVVEQMPLFPGCEGQQDKLARKQCSDKSLIKFLYSHLKYPNIARENGITGTVVVQFVIETDGSVSDIVLRKDIGGQCGAEAVRVVELMNAKGIKWTAGKQRGKPVRVQFNLPIRFNLNN